MHALPVIFLQVSGLDCNPTDGVVAALLKCCVWQSVSFTIRLDNRLEGHGSGRSDTTGCHGHSMFTLHYA